jgi:hypothetical protein
MTRAYNTATTQQNSGGAVPAFVAGKNKIINGDFGVWQRGTTFTSPVNTAYTADRFYEMHDGTGTVTVTRQAFTPGTAPVAGYEGSYFHRQAVTSAGNTTFFQTGQRIEDVTTFAGQTVTVSFWAKADTTRTGLVYGDQLFGTGGSSTVQLAVNTYSLTTSWQRFSFVYTIPSISGKTIGTSSSLAFYFRNGGTVSGATIDLWGIQVEAGSVATSFQTATGTIQGELAACQRYYYRATPANSYYSFGSAFSNATTTMLGLVPFPVTMRIAPTALEQRGTASEYGIQQGATGITCSAVPAFSNATTYNSLVQYTVASGLTIGQAGLLRNENNITAFLAWSAEL